MTTMEKITITLPSGYTYAVPAYTDPRGGVWTSTHDVDGNPTVVCMYCAAGSRPTEPGIPFTANETVRDEYTEFAWSAYQAARKALLNA